MPTMYEEERVCDESQNNGFADVANIDASVGDDQAPEEALNFDDALATLEETVTKHPLNRELMYKTLAFCSEERELGAIEAYIAASPEFKTATQTPYHLIITLEKGYGLARTERDQYGATVTPEHKIGLNEDELDDLVCSESYRTTEVGARFVARHHPRARLVELLNLTPERTETYLDLLNYVAENPRTYAEITSFLKDKPALETLIDGKRTIMQPSVFVDNLERSGALVWKGGWTLTEEGYAYLKELRGQ